RLSRKLSERLRTECSGEVTGEARMVCLEHDYARRAGLLFNVYEDLGGRTRILFCHGVFEGSEDHNRHPAVLMCDALLPYFQHQAYYSDLLLQRRLKHWPTCASTPERYVI